MGEVDPHFVELRREIRKKVRDKYGEAELAKYPCWLYGALGDPNADVMFVCENPSRAGVRKANKHFSDCGIEAQWRGHPADRFRRVLCETGLKSGEPGDPGGWRCYITNVIKEMWVVKEFRPIKERQKLKIAREWADVLQWELDQVKPKIVFCVGDAALRAMCLIEADGYLDRVGLRVRRICHYSKVGTNADVEREMRKGVEMGLKGVPICGPYATGGA